MDKIKKVMELFAASNLSSMELEVDEFKIKMNKPITTQQPLEQQDNKQICLEPVVNKKIIEQSNDYELIKSKLVGTFYASDEQGKPPLVKVNDHINQGDIIGIVEAMKVMNEIKAPFSGVVKQIFVKDGQLVGFDDQLMEIDCDD